MGNHNAGCCSTKQPRHRGNLRDGPEERPRTYTGARRRNTRTRSRSRSVSRRRGARRNRDVSPKGRRSGKSRSNLRSYNKPNEVAPASQQQMPMNFVRHSRVSYDIPSRKGSNYVDPLSFTPSGSEVGASRGGNSSLDLCYFAPQSPVARRAHVTSGSRAATNSHNLMSRGTNLDDDSQWNKTKAIERSWGDETERPALSHVNSVREKVYSSGPPQIKPDMSRLIAPGRQKVHSGSSGQKRNGNVRGSNAQPSRMGYVQHTTTQYKGHHEASRSREDSFIPPSHGRERQNAVRVDTFEMPSGVYKGDRRYIQFGNGLWETVTIDGWNCWNGTWQVSDTSGRSIQAAPLALKTEDEYRFLSKDRTIRYRSIGSFV